MQSSDPRRFFETDAAQELRERRAAKSSNKYGHPVVLKSKVLAVLADPTSPLHVFVAESAGSARRVNVDDSGADSKAASSGAYRGPVAPVTCLALGGLGQKTLFAGCWDKSIWSFDRDTREPGIRFTGHTDFVKAVVAGRLGSQDVLISGSADKKIIVWDVASGKRLHTLQDSGPTVSDRQSMLAVQDLAIDPVATTADEILLVSASSDPNIRRWRIRLDGWEQVVEHESGGGGGDGDGDGNVKTASKSLLAHETTVYKVVFDDSNYSGGGDKDENDGDEVDLWTSSADGTAKCLSRMHGFRHNASGEGNTYQHGNHARSVAVTDAWVITAGRDEDLQFWDRAGSSDDNSNSRYATITGHYDEVTDLAVLADGRRLCSVSLDGTVRTWPLARAELDAVVAQQKEDQEKAATGAVVVEETKAEEEGLMTAEEEAELAALMEDD